MGPCKFKITLRLRHPTLLADSISGLVGASPSISWSVGQSRTTAKGEALGGVRRETYWALELAGDDDEDATLAERLNRLLAMFEGKHKQVRCFRASGGSVECLLGIFVDNNCGVILDHALLRRLAYIGIQLAFDIYGGRPITQEADAVAAD